MVIVEEVGILPESVKDGKDYVIVEEPALNDCLDTFKRKTKDGTGEFTQYILFVKADGEENSTCFNFLMKTQLQPLRRSWGKDSKEWIGRKVHAKAEKDGEYWNVSFAPLEA